MASSLSERDLWLVACGMGLVSETARVAIQTNLDEQAMEPTEQNGCARNLYKAVLKGDREEAARILGVANDEPERFKVFERVIRELQRRRNLRAMRAIEFNVRLPEDVNEMRASLARAMQRLENMDLLGDEPSQATA